MFSKRASYNYLLYFSLSQSVLDDGFGMEPKSLHTWMTRLMYARRSKFNPLWNNLIIGGFNNGKP
jgi:20S proteasome subunit beta 7